jgi:hypothetical protein
MYPLVEFLAAVLLYSWSNLRLGFSRRQAALFTVASVLALLTHYATAFYLASLLFTLVLGQRRRPVPVLGILTLAIFCFSWWLPALLAQMKHENFTNFLTISTGAVILLTLFHFFTGDRGLALGACPDLTAHLYPLFSFSAAMALAGYLLWKRRQETGSLCLLANCLLPLGLHWSATFLVQRVYNATYYAVYSLPVFLVLITRAVSRKDSSYLCLRTSLLLIMILVNGVTLASFLRNTLVPYEPWKRACAVLRTFNPVRVFVYPSHMAAMLTFHGEGLSVEGIDFNCSSQDAEKKVVALIGTPNPGNTLLVLSHDWGKGDGLVTCFQRALRAAPREFVFPNIRVFLFHRPEG